MTDDSKKLIAYSMYGKDPLIRAAPSMRQWMDDTPQSYAYRCLPLNIANMHGWEILCPVDFKAIWDGTDGKDCIQIESDGPEHLRPISHFGSGILTFHVGALFRTPPDYNLFVTGPLNMPKDGIVGLSGIIETDWAPYTFTMNWRFTTGNNEVEFKQGEPICCFFPIPRGYLENFEPEIHAIQSNPDLNERHHEWAASRSSFITDLRAGDSAAVEEKWQKNYYRGKMPDGEDGIEGHQIKLRLKEFKKIS